MKTTHTIMHGDCIQRMKELQNNSIHLTISSPPYYNAKDYATGEGNIGKNENYIKYLALIEEVAIELFRITKPGCCVAWNTSPVINEGFRYMLPYEMYNIFIRQGFVCRDEIVWAKPDGASALRCGGWVQNKGKPLTWHPNIVDERIQVFQKPGKANMTGQFTDFAIYYPERPKDILTDIWYMNPETNTKWHPAPFCKELAKRCILLYSFEGDTVLDPFAGSGTTMKQAIELNRNSIGIELSDEYIPKLKEKIGFGIQIEGKELEFLEK